MKNHRNCRHYKIWWRCPAEKAAVIECRAVFYVGDFCVNYEPDIPENNEDNQD